MKNRIALFFLCCISVSIRAQTPVIDSLKKVVSDKKADTLVMNAYRELTYEYLSIDLDSAKYFAETEIKKYGNSKHLLFLSDAYSALATVYGYRRDFDNSLVNFKKSLEILLKTSNKNAIAKAHFNVGLVYYYTSRYEPAIAEYLAALKTIEGTGDKEMLANISNGLGGIYKDMRNYNDAMRYYQKCLSIYSEIKDSLGMASAYNNVGTVLDFQEKLDEALTNYKKSLELKGKIGYERGMSSTLNNIGIILSKKKDYDNALQYFNNALSYSGPSEDKISQSVSYEGIGVVYYEKKNYPLALQFLEKSLKLASETGSKIDMASAYEKLALCYAALGNYVKAFSFQKLLIETKDSVLNEENSKQINEMAAKYESEKKQLLIENLNKDNALQIEELEKKELQVKQQNIQKIFFAIGFLLVSVLAFFIFRSYRLKQQSNTIITAQKKEVELQRDLLEVKSKEITDSIFYARRIQNALLASETLLNKYLPEYFVLHKPKDIVSGDFYWATSVKPLSGSSEKELFYLAVADCTGHGVPGAFMSLLNISFLNEALVEKKIDSPEKILEHVRNRVISSLNPEGTETESKDGMDGILCMIDLKGMWLRFSCANNSLWLIRNNELKIFAADKMPVGKHYGEQKPFTLHTLGLRKGDIIYMLTDGYADQFGGAKGKKFKYRQLQDLLVKNSAMTMKEQKVLLDQTIESWRGALDQVDDILVVGIKF
jgi:tetratricopeptide (TPR) repeat protein